MRFTIVCVLKDFFFVLSNFPLFFGENHLFYFYLGIYLRSKSRLFSHAYSSSFSWAWVILSVYWVILRMRISNFPNDIVIFLVFPHLPLVGRKLFYDIDNKMFNYPWVSKIWIIQLCVYIYLSAKLKYWVYK